MLQRIYGGMRTLLFHNPGAGRGDHSKSDLVAGLRAAGHDVRYFPTKGDAFEEGLKEKADLFVVAGGDGTVGKVLTRMPVRSIPVAILPFGTANNIASSLGISGEFETIVAGWQEGRQERFDIGLAVGPWGRQPFVEAVGWGPMATVIDRTTGEEAEGHAQLQLKIAREALIRTFREAESFEATVDIDGQTVTATWIAVEVLFNYHTGPRLPLNTAAGTGDGAFELLCIRPEERDDMIDWLASPESAPPPVKLRQGSRIAFAWAPQQVLRIDDDLQEARGGGRPVVVTAEIQEMPLVMLLPGNGFKAAVSLQATGSEG